MEKRHKTAAKCGSKTPESTEAPQAIETPESTTPAEASVTAEDVTSTAASLTAANIPAEYLCGGYYKGEGKTRYPDPNLVGETAQTLAHDLAAGGLRQSTLNPILRDLKKANKKTLPLDAKHGALSGAIVQAKQLQQRRRAPGLLVEILERNRAAVQIAADYTAAVKHLTAVGVFLGDYQQQATEGAKK